MIKNLQKLGFEYTYESAEESDDNKGMISFGLQDYAKNPDLHDIKIDKTYLETAPKPDELQPDSKKKKKNKKSKKKKQTEQEPITINTSAVEK
jgi:hypothetical protein